MTEPLGFNPLDQPFNQTLEDPLSQLVPGLEPGSEQTLFQAQQAAQQQQLELPPVAPEVTTSETLVRDITAASAIRLREDLPRVSIEQPDFGDFLQANIQDKVFGPFIAVAEKMRLLPPETREQVRENFLQVRELFINEIDEETDEPFSGRTLTANTSSVLLSLIPLLPGGLFGPIAKALSKTGTVARTITRATITGAAEGALVGADIALQKEGPGPLGFVAATLAGAGIGNVGGRFATRHLTDAREGKGMLSFFQQDESVDFTEWSTKWKKSLYQKWFNEEQPLEDIVASLRRSLKNGEVIGDNAIEDAKMLELLTNRLRFTNQVSATGISNKPLAVVRDPETGEISHHIASRKFIDADGIEQEVDIESLDNILGSGYRETRELGVKVSPMEFKDDLESLMAAQHEVELRARHAIALREGGDAVDASMRFHPDALPKALDDFDRISGKYGRTWSEANQDLLTRITTRGEDVGIDPADLEEITNSVAVWDFGGLERTAERIREWSSIDIENLVTAEFLTRAEATAIIAKNRLHIPQIRGQRDDLAHTLGQNAMSGKKKNQLSRLERVHGGIGVFKDPSGPRFDNFKKQQADIRRGLSVDPDDLLTDPTVPIMRPLDAIAEQHARLNRMIDHQLVMRQAVDIRLKEDRLMNGIHAVRVKTKGPGEGTEWIPDTELREAATRRAKETSGTVAPFQLVDSEVGEITIKTADEIKKLTGGTVEDPIALFQSFVEDTPGTFSVFRKIDAIDAEGQLFEKIIRERWTAPDDMLRALKVIRPDEGGFVIKMLRGPTQMLRKSATLLNPIFGVKNLGRDQWMAAVHSKHGFFPIYSPMRAWIDRVSSKQGRTLWDEWKSLGGDSSTFVGHTTVDDVLGATRGGRTKLGKGIDKSLKLARFSPGTQGILKGMKNPFYAFERFSSGLEQATRFAEYRAARIKNMSMLDAFSDAQEVTLNFSRGGTYGRQVNQVEAFFNAQLQDIDRFARGMKNNPMRTGLLGFSFITMPALVNWAANEGDEDYENRPEWEKSLFYHVGSKYLPWLEKGQFVKMPRPLGGINTLLGLVPEAFMRNLAQRDRDVTDRIFKALADTTPLPLLGLDPRGDKSFGVPLGISAAGQMLIPTALDPIIEVITNYDPFFDREVVPKRLQDELKIHQFDNSTSEVAKAIAGVFNGSPLKVQSLIEGYFATTGKLTAQAADALFFSGEKRLLDPRTEGVPSQGIQGRRFADIPVLGGIERTFITDATAYGITSQPARDFFELREASEEALNRLEAATTFQERRRILSERPEAILVKELRRVGRQISKYSEARREIQAADHIDDVRRLDMMLRIDQAVSAYSTMAMERYGMAILATKKRVDTGSFFPDHLFPLVGGSE